MIVMPAKKERKEVSFFNTGKTFQILPKYTTIPILLEPAMVKASVYFFYRLIEVAVNLLST